MGLSPSFGCFIIARRSNQISRAAHIHLYTLGYPRFSRQLLCIYVCIFAREIQTTSRADSIFNNSRQEIYFHDIYVRKIEKFFLAQMSAHYATGKLFHASEYLVGILIGLIIQFTIRFPLYKNSHISDRVIEPSYRT